MAFQMPEYHQPDFSKEQFIKAPDAKWEIVEIDGVAPEYFHSTSMFPEYFKIQGKVTRLFLDGAKPVRREFMSTVQDSRQKRTRLRINLCSARDEAGRPPMRETMTA